MTFFVHPFVQSSITRLFAPFLVVFYTSMGSQWSELSNSLPIWIDRLDGLAARGRQNW